MSEDKLFCFIMNKHFSDAYKAADCHYQMQSIVSTQYMKRKEFLHATE